MSERTLLLSGLHVDSCIGKPVLFQRPENLFSVSSNLLTELNFKIASPVGLQNKERWENWKITQNIERNLLKEITPILNEVLSKELSQRQWMILIGHWLRRFIQVVINRSTSLENCYTEYKIASCVVQDVKMLDLAPINSINAVELFSNDIWNEGLSKQIIEFLKLGDLKTLTSNYVLDKPIENNRKSSKKFAKKVLSFYNNQVSKFKRPTDNLFVATYLPTDVLIKLQLKIGELPTLFYSDDFAFEKKYDSKIRSHIKQRIVTRDYDTTTEKLIKSLLAYYIPSSYLENFNKYWSSVENCNWPKNPKTIVTSNCFDTNEKFKFYVMQKIQNGTRYFVGQHGNNYGTNGLMSPTIEEITSDKFLTWGWGQNRKQYVPTFCLKSPTPIPLSQSATKKYLIINFLHSPWRTSTWDDRAEFEHYLYEQSVFFNNLRDDIQDITLVRLHPAQMRYELELASFFEKCRRKVNIEKPGKSMSKSKRSAKLIVHSYDSTGLLETISERQPCIAFWANGLSHLNELATDDYSKLVESDIVHLAPQSAAEHVNRIWDKLDAWWNSDHLEQTCMQFSNKYCRKSVNPVNELKMIFKN